MANYHVVVVAVANHCKKREACLCRLTAKVTINTARDDDGTHGIIGIEMLQEAHNLVDHCLGKGIELCRSIKIDQSGTLSVINNDFEELKMVHGTAESGNKQLWRER